VQPGEVVTYTYEVTNRGDDPLVEGVVTDDRSVSAGYESGDTNRDDVLDVGEVWVYRCSQALTADTVNTAGVTAKDSLGNSVRDEDWVIVDVLITGPKIEKRVDRETIYAGEQVTYVYEVRNTGSDPIHAVSVRDDGCGPLSAPVGDTTQDGLLDPSETWVYTCTMSLQEDTENVATVSGEDALGDPVPEDVGTVPAGVAGHGKLGFWVPARAALPRAGTFHERQIAS